MTIEDRIRQVQLEAAAHGMDIHAAEESIRRRIRSMERKVLRLQREDAEILLPSPGKTQTP